MSEWTEHLNSLTAALSASKDWYTKECLESAIRVHVKKQYQHLVGQKPESLPNPEVSSTDTHKMLK
jgi:hypothetical protein